MAMAENVYCLRRTARQMAACSATSTQSPLCCYARFGLAELITLLSIWRFLKIVDSVTIAQGPYSWHWRAKVSHGSKSGNHHVKWSTPHPTLFYAWNSPVPHSLGLAERDLIRPTGMQHTFHFTPLLLNQSFRWRTQETRECFCCACSIVAFWRHRSGCHSRSNVSEGALLEANTGENIQNFAVDLGWPSATQPSEVSYLIIRV